MGATQPTSEDTKPQKLPTKKDAVVIPKVGIARKQYLAEKNLERRTARKAKKAEEDEKFYKIAVQKQKEKGTSKNLLRKMLSLQWLLSDGKWERLIDKFEVGQTINLTPVDSTLILATQIIKKTENRIFVECFTVHGSEYECNGVIFKSCYKLGQQCLKVVGSVQRRKERASAIKAWRNGVVPLERRELEEWFQSKIKVNQKTGEEKDGR